METRSADEILVILQDGRLNRGYQILSVKPAVILCGLGNTYILPVNVYQSARSNIPECLNDRQLICEKLQIKLFLLYHTNKRTTSHTHTHTHTHIRGQEFIATRFGRIIRGVLISS